MSKPKMVTPILNLDVVSGDNRWKAKREYFMALENMISVMRETEREGLGWLDYPRPPRERQARQAERVKWAALQALRGRP